MMKIVNASKKSKDRCKEYAKTDKAKKYRRDWARNKYNTDEEYRRKAIQASVDTERRRYENGDIQYKLKQLCRARIRNAMKGLDKSKATGELMGCSWKELQDHLSSQFREGMSWDNHGIHGWHIDHIRPCNSFDLRDPEQQKLCFHYTNLQPLWAHENLEKSDTWFCLPVEAT